MQQVGVEAVVEGLARFLGDMRRVNSAIDGLRPSGTLLQRAFESLGEAVLGFGSHILRVAEVTIGVILRDAINFIIGKLSELVRAVIESGVEFQLLQLRLERLNLNTLLDSGMEYNKATEESIRLTKEQLRWIQKLAATSPYDAQEVANVYTLSRAFGFTSEEAEKLTTNILDFTAGMGLSSQEIERVIINFGQLAQQGKLNGQELRDLARGSFVPINDVLERMSRNMGISVEELNRMRQAGEGGREMVFEFIRAFNEMAEERFKGASATMSRSILGATANVRDLFQSILGLNVLGPVFDVLGGKIADMVESFTGTDRWDEFLDTADAIGATLAEIVSVIISELIPSADSMAIDILDAVKGFSEWLEANKGKIVDFFIGIRDAIKNDIIPWIRDNLIPTFQRIWDWIRENGPRIQEFFQSLIDIIGMVFADLFGGHFESTDFLGGLLSILENVMQFVIDNKEQIADFIVLIARFIIAWQILVTVFNIVVGVIGTIVGAFISAIAVVSTIIRIVTLFGSQFSLILLGIIAAILAFVIQIGAFVVAIVTHWDQVSAGARRMRDVILGVFGVIPRVVAQAITNIALRIRERFAAVISTARERAAELLSAFTSIDWGRIGADIVFGIGNAINEGRSFLIQSAVDAAVSAYEAVLDALGISSPSRLFMEVGEMSMLGLAEGIDRYAALAADAMTDAVGHVVAPTTVIPAAVAAASSGRSSTYNNERTNNYNLSIHSNSDREPIIQDFGLLQSLQGN